jgi:HEAT repeat protein
MFHDAKEMGTMNVGTEFNDLIAALYDERPDVRRSAAERLGDLGDARAVEPLTQALKDDDADVRQCAALALGMIGEASATALLTYALKEESNEAVREALAIALDMIKRSIMSKKMPFLSTHDTEHMQYVIRTLHSHQIIKCSE